MKKEHQLKKEHHYVWANYLRTWSSSTNKIWFRSIKGKVIEDSVRLIAKERHFYHIKDLNQNHINLIRMISSKSDIKSSHEILLNKFILIQAMNKEYNTLDLVNNDIEQYFSIHKHNTLENIHSLYERGANICLKHLKNKDLSILNDSELAFNFLHYLGHQLCRTKSFKHMIIKSFDNNSASLSKLANESWWFLSHVFGDNMSYSMYQDYKNINHCLLINKTDSPFITSDNPVINIHNELDQAVMSVPQDHQFDLYYPISPEIAYVYCSSKQFKSGLTEIDINKVHMLNEHMAKMAYIHIFSNTEDSIKTYKNYVGTNNNNIEKHFHKKCKH